MLQNVYYIQVPFLQQHHWNVSLKNSWLKKKGLKKKCHYDEKGNVKSSKSFLSFTDFIVHHIADPLGRVLDIADALCRAAKALTEVSKVDTCRPKREPSSLKSYKTDSDADEEENFVGDDINLPPPFTDC